MYNLIISIVVAALVTLIIKLAGFPLLAGVPVGVIALFATFIVLARRVSNRVQALMTEVQKELSVQITSERERQQRVDKAIKILESGLVWDKWQILVGSEIHAQIGMLLYMVKDFDGAFTHLSKAHARNSMAMAMLGALHYQRKEYAKMEERFEAAVKAGKKEAILWATYAWCLVQMKEKDKALKVMARAVEINPSDEKLKSGMAQLQNDKRLKMKPYEPMWWQFGLESPPPQMMGGRRVQFQRR